MTGPIRFRLPATSANLGPGFDAVGLALQLYLEVQASAAAHWSVDAHGRDTKLIGRLEDNLLIETYRKLAPHAPPLHLTLRNEIPLGMGCGSSAAALLAGVLLANHFGRLDWPKQQILEQACRLEGHPDNVAACYLGGFTVASMDAEQGSVTTTNFPADFGWRVLLVLPSTALSTSKARALLPADYTRADAVLNVQSTALLVSAFAQGRPDLLQAGTRDRLHQPYRAGVCPLLARLQALAGQNGIYSVTLSGAGPSVLFLAAAHASTQTVESSVRTLAGDLLPTLLWTAVNNQGVTIVSN